MKCRAAANARFRGDLAVKLLLFLPFQIFISLVSLLRNPISKTQTTVLQTTAGPKTYATWPIASIYNYAKDGS